MSMQLFKTDFISVIWEYQKKEQATETHDIWEYIHLFFTIQINGKIRTFQHYIELVQYIPTIENDCWTVFTLKNYEGWYILYNTLNDLWYPLWEPVKYNPMWGNIINSWIDKCYEDFIYVDEHQI